MEKIKKKTICREKKEAHSESKSMINKKYVYTFKKTSFSSDYPKTKDHWLYHT